MYMCVYIYIYTYAYKIPYLKNTFVFITNLTLDLDYTCVYIHVCVYVCVCIYGTGLLHM